jgi:hypothetical protein
MEDSGEKGGQEQEMPPVSVSGGINLISSLTFSFFPSLRMTRICGKIDFS